MRNIGRTCRQSWATRSDVPVPYEIGIPLDWGAPYLKADDGRKAFGASAQRQERTEQPSFLRAWLRAYFALLPLLWLTGLMLPAGLMLMAAAAMVTLPTPGFRYGCPWYVVGAAQLLSVFINWTQDPHVATLVKHLFSTYVYGWFVIGAAISTGASGLIPLQAATIAIRRIARYWALLAIPAAAAAYLGESSSLVLVTPVGHLLPDSFPAKSFWFSIFVFTWDELFGMQLPRVVLFFPWSNVLGIAGIAVLLVGLADCSRRRWTLRAIGPAMVWASVGRMPILALLIVLCLHAWLTVRLAALRMLLLVVPLWLLATMAMANGFTPGTVQNWTAALDEGRAGSSQVRAAVYEANWRGFYQAPILGHGWPGSAVPDAGQEDRTFGGEGGGAVAGSHSTISGLLYKGGLVTFTALVFAFVLTAMPLAIRLTKSGNASAAGISHARHTQSAFCFIVTLAIAGLVEGIESFAMPLAFVFVWLGSVLNVAHHTEQAA